MIGLAATVIYVPLGQQYLSENPSAAQASVPQPDPPRQTVTSDAAVCDEYDNWTLAAVDVGNRPDHVEGAQMRDLAAEAQHPRLRAALLEEAQLWEAGYPYVDSDVFTVCDNLGY